MLTAHWPSSHETGLLDWSPSNPAVGRFPPFKNSLFPVSIDAGTPVLYSQIEHAMLY